MDRRKFIRLSSCATTAGLIGANSAAHALEQCFPFNNQGIQRCDVGINSQLANIEAQINSQWCWAASIQMVFRYYGLYVSQNIIVSRTWGSIQNLPAQPHVIMANLNQLWMGSNGARFSVTGNTNTANHRTASQDLANDKPLIIGTLGHAMVLTALTFDRDQWGNGEVKSAVVRDPWPQRGRRVLTPQEWYNISFAARIRVRRLP